MMTTTKLTLKNILAMDIKIWSLNHPKPKPPITNIEKCKSLDTGLITECIIRLDNGLITIKGISQSTILTTGRIKDPKGR